MMKNGTPRMPKSNADMSTSSEMPRKYDRNTPLTSPMRLSVSLRILTGIQVAARLPIRSISLSK